MAYTPSGYGPSQMAWYYNYFNTSSYGTRFSAEAVPLDMDRRIKEIAAFDQSAASQLQGYRNSVKDNPWGSWEGFVNTEVTARNRYAAQIKAEAEAAAKQTAQLKAAGSTQKASVGDGAPDAPTPSDTTTANSGMSANATVSTQIAGDGPRRRYTKQSGVPIGGTQGGVGIRI